VGFSRQEGSRLGDVFRIFLGRDLPRAGAGAALDLEEQTGPGSVLVIAVVARAQEERALEGVDGAVDRPDAGEGTVIIPFALTRSAMLDELRRLVIPGEEDIGQ